MTNLEKIDAMLEDLRNDLEKVSVSVIKTVSPSSFMFDRISERVMIHSVIQNLLIIKEKVTSGKSTLEEESDSFIADIVRLSFRNFGTTKSDHQVLEDKIMKETFRLIRQFASSEMKDFMIKFRTND